MPDANGSNPNANRTTVVTVPLESSTYDTLGIAATLQRIARGRLCVYALDRVAELLAEVGEREGAALLMSSEVKLAFVPVNAPVNDKDGAR